MATTCPIFQPPGASNGTYYGTNQPLPFPDRTLNELSGNDRLDGEIIVELSGTSCLNGLPFDTLLSRLQNDYPDSMWTPSLLQQQLKLGRRQGRFCLAGNNTWVLRSDMVTINYNNQKFQGLTKSIIGIPIFQTTVVGNINGTYDGDEPSNGNVLCGIPRLTGLIPPNVLRALKIQLGQ